MNSYYVYIELERIRVFDGKTLELLEFNIDGLKTKELYNTCKFDYDEGCIKYEPLHRSYELNYLNVFSYDVNACGVSNIQVSIFTIVSQMYFILENLSINDGEIRIIFSWSFYSFLVDREIALNYEKVYDHIFRELNKNTNRKISFCGCYFMHMLVRGVLEFFQNETKDNLLYIDEKNLIIIKKDKKFYSSKDVCWSIDSKNERQDLDNNLINYLKAEEMYNSKDDANNLKNYIFYEAKQGNNIKSVVIRRRDEIKEIDCSILNNYLEQREIEKYNNLKKLLSEVKDYLDEKSHCFLNIRDDAIKNKVVNILSNYPISIERKENFIKYIFKYCEIIDKYNTAYIKLKVKKLIERRKIPFNDVFFLDKIYYIFRITENNKEIDEICKCLGVKSFKMDKKKGKK